MIFDNIVSAETALKLKEAGFPQPVPRAGQIWLDVNNFPYIILEDSSISNPALKYPYQCRPIVFVPATTYWYASKKKVMVGAYMPMVTDLFPRVTYALWKNKATEGYEWIAYSEQIEEAPEGFSHPQNPCEALAKLWMAQNG